MKPHREAVEAADRLDREYDLLERQFDTPLTESTEPVAVELLLVQAKRVRREATAVVRSLARFRDHLQSEEDTR